MPASLHKDYPPDLSQEQERYILATVKDWCIQHGLTVRPSPAFVPESADENRVLATTAPVTIFPTIFPRVCFQQVQNLQTTYNELYAAISNDEEWIEELMEGYCTTADHEDCDIRLIKVDDFISSLWKVHQSVKKEGYVQDLSLGLFRSDYMLHLLPDEASPSIKQVEFNTIASSFAGLSSLVSSLHTHLMTFPDPSAHLAYPSHPIFGKRAATRTSIELGYDPAASISSHTSINLPPRNNAVQVLVNGLSSAHIAYGESKSQPQIPLCIIFLVQDHDRNIFDQLALSSSSNFPIFRLLTNEILSHTTIDPENPSRPLIYLPPSSSSQTRFEVTTLYFRALYSPAEYTSPDIWTARLHLERSAAIKCPSVLTHLAGSKKIQQVLTSKTPDHLSRFLPNTDARTLSSLRSTFAPQYDLSPNSTGLEIALDPDRARNHVLKPQREGGGNNIYRIAIPNFLKSLPSTNHYLSYILMELIEPPAEAKNTVLRSDGHLVSGPVVSEFGVFGACLWRKKKKQREDRQDGKAGFEILHNQGDGYLVRTKGRDSDEGGVAAGFSSLDSVLLYDDGEV